MINISLGEIIESNIKKIPLQDISYGALEASQARDEKIRNVILEKTFKLEESDKQRLINEFTSYGPLTELFEDEQITEIIVTGKDSIWFEKNGSLFQQNDTFISEFTFQSFLVRLCQDANIHYNVETPTAQGKFKDFRVHLVSSVITQGSTVVCLRRHPKSPWTFEKFLKNNWCSQEQMQIIKNMMQQRKNFLVVGTTGCGKTSLLNACLNSLQENERVVVIEDTSELVVPNKVSNKLLTRLDVQNILPPIDQSELVKQSLRMRPDRLVVGEVRGGEAKDLLMALSTGHEGSFGTLHASSAEQALLRLEMLIQLGAPKWSLQAIRSLIHLSLNYILVVEKKPAAGRRLQGIYEICSLEQTGFLIERVA